MKCSWKRSNFFLEQRLWTRRTNKDQSTNRVACSDCLDKLWRMCRIRHGTRFVHDVLCDSHHSIHRWISHVWCFSANLSRFEKIPIHLQSAKEKEGQTHWIFLESLKFKVQEKALQIVWFFVPAYEWRGVLQQNKLNFSSNGPKPSLQSEYCWQRSRN